MLSATPTIFLVLALISGVAAFQCPASSFSLSTSPRHCTLLPPLRKPSVCASRRMQVPDSRFTRTGEGDTLYHARGDVAVASVASGGKGEEGEKPASEEKKGFLAKLKGMFKAPSKEQLAAMGVGALLSYGAISNINMAVIFMISWVTFGKSTGLSPLDLDQWPKFMAVYAGFWLAANFLRPFRIATAVAVAPLFDRLVNFWQSKLRISKPQAVGLTVFLVNVLGNMCFLTLGTVAVTKIAGVPLLATKL